MPKRPLKTGDWIEIPPGDHVYKLGYGRIKRIDSKYIIADMFLRNQEDNHPYRGIRFLSDYYTHFNSTVTVLNPKQLTLETECEKTLKDLGQNLWNSLKIFRIQQAPRECLK